MFWLELAVVLLSILIGARVGGVGLGVVAAIGLGVLIFGFGLAPGSPPVTVIAIIMAVVSAAATMQAAGGMDLLVSLAERALHAKPQWITFAGPTVAYIFTFCSGTGHVAYALLPVIAEVARKAGVRPERPLSISVIASQRAITASPLSAATAGMLVILSEAGLTVGGHPVQLWHILVICIPSTFIGCMLGALSVCFVGKELKDDPIYQDRLARGVIEAPRALPRLEGRARRNAIGSVVVFLLAAAAIVSLGMMPSLRHLLGAGEATTKPIAMPDAIQVLMYASAGITMLLFGARPDAIVKTSVATAGVVAVIAIVGLGWLGSCFFEGNREFVVSGMKSVIEAHPWVFAVGLFTLSILLYSQAATVTALMPVGVLLGLPAATLIAMFPATNGYFFLPTYGTIVAAVAFDQTGTTRIGKYVLNHSFMLPGMVSTVSAVVIGFGIAKVIF